LVLPAIFSAIINASLEEVAVSLSLLVPLRIFSIENSELFEVFEALCAG